MSYREERPQLEIFSSNLRRFMADKDNHSMLIAAGVPVSEVSAQLGHASVDITLRVYTHLFTEASTASRAISDAINAKWAPGGHPTAKKKAVRFANARLRMVRMKGLEPK